MFRIAIESRDRHAHVRVSDCNSVENVRPGRHVATWEQRPSDLVAVTTEHGGFSFWPDELETAGQMLVRATGVALVDASDDRSFDEIDADTQAGHGLTALASFELQEDSFDAAAARGRDLPGPTWLGLARDYRLFGVGFAGVGEVSDAERVLNWISPMHHAQGVEVEEAGAAINYRYSLGRGVGSQHDVRRWLHDGCLPVLHADVIDGAIVYHVTAFVALESSRTSSVTVEGTDSLIADGVASGHMFTPEQQTEHDNRAAQYLPSEQTVLHLRIRAENTSDVSRHAFLGVPAPYRADAYTVHDHEFRDGFGTFTGGRVFVAASLNGEPVGREETAILLAPGADVILDVAIPHSPVSEARAQALLTKSFERTLSDVVDYWREKLSSAARIRVPDERIDKMISAGLLHLDLVSFGAEPTSPVAPMIGVYSPIGSESGPIIQFFDSMGWSSLAGRSLDYFAMKQHPDGFIQNFGGYMLETEAILWSFGEHYRITRDQDWLRRLAPTIKLAVNYILTNRRLQRSSGADPHGLLVGKVADPEDHFAIYMLNGFAAMGLARAAEMMADLEPPLAALWLGEAEQLRADIRDSLAEAMKTSPVVPLSDGAWSRTAPPWAGHRGPVMIARDGGPALSHGTITTRDALLGPLWLIAQEVIDPTESIAQELLEFSADLAFHDNAAFSQPYYSPHPLVHLRRGEVGAFLHAYFTMVASLADRETFSFWEHYFHASAHKTHEEAWFLMQTRWMLYLEAGDTLQLFPGVPRTWLAAGERIELTNVRSYFGAIRANLEVSADGLGAHVSVVLEDDRLPATLSVRLPHPSGPRGATTSLGDYNPNTETVSIGSPNRITEFEITWQ